MALRGACCQSIANKKKEWRLRERGRREVDLLDCKRAGRRLLDRFSIFGSLLSRTRAGANAHATDALEQLGYGDLQGCSKPRDVS